MTGSATLLKQFPNGDEAVDYGNGPVYRTPEALYTVELDPPGHPLSGEPFGVDFVRTTRSEYGLEREQRLTLAEYSSYMAAEEHVREVEGKLLETGRDGLQTEMALVETMPYEPDVAVYVVGLYPPDPAADRGALNLLRLDGERLDIAPVAHGRVAELTAVEQRLVEVQATGDTGRLLEAAALEAMRADELAPNTPLFAFEGEEVALDKVILMNTDSTPPEWENHPDWPDLSAWDQPPAPKPAALVLPVTFGEDMTPYDEHGRYVPNHRDEVGTVHFFSMIDRPSDSPLPEDVAHELRYFRAQKTGEGVVVHDSQLVMPVSDPTTSPWPLPALHLHLEDSDLDAAQKLARDTARDNGLSFPDKLPALGAVEELQPQPEPGWYHFDTALVSADPQGVDDQHSVGVVDVYANHTNGQWVARYLPLGDFETFDGAQVHQEYLLFRRAAEDRESALATDGFNRSPAVYERIAQMEADDRLTDLLEYHDGHLPLDWEGEDEPEWEPLTSKEWGAYRDHIRTVTEVVPGTDHIRESLPTATPGFANDTLVAASAQPDAPYLQPNDFKAQLIAPTWRLDIVPARDPDGAPLGYSAVCVVDFSDLAETLSPATPERAQWLEVAQFQTEDRAQKFKDDFLSLAGSDELGHITGPMLAGVIADDLEMDSRWQILDQAALEKLKASEWAVTHEADNWRPRLSEVSPNHVIEATNFDLDL